MSGSVDRRLSLDVQHLSRTFAKREVVCDLSFQVSFGSTLGLLGSNGAGKSTTLRMLSGCLIPSKGGIQVGGYDMHVLPLQAKRKLGYLPESNPIYTDCYVSEYIYYIARLQQLSPKDAKDRTQFCIERCGLLEVQHRKLKTLSKGYRQRVGIARTLVHDPEVLILDEPFSGLDTEQLESICKLIEEVRSCKAVVLSTHRLSEAALLCDRVLVLKAGRKAFWGSTTQWQRSISLQEPLKV